MKITLIEPRGFCFGVCRALNMLDDIQERPIYVLHEIVHNQSVVNSYKQKGFIFVNDLSEIPNGSTVVFSAHGVSKQIECEAQKKDLKIIDTICPFVNKVHKWVQNLEEEGREIILIGKPKHAEIIGTMGQLKELTKVHVIQTIEDIENLPFLEKVGIATQTTLSEDEVKEFIMRLKERYPDCVIQSGICQATTDRQNALKKACLGCDTILVIGDKNSSNCMRLIEIAKEHHCDAYLIEQAADVQKVKLGEKIGITAAASAPEEIVQETLRLLESNG